MIVRPAFVISSLAQCSPLMVWLSIYPGAEQTTAPGVLPLPGLYLRVLFMTVGEQHAANTDILRLGQLPVFVCDQNTAAALGWAST